MTKISQREARALRKRVAELETVLDRQRNAWRAEWPNGVNIATVSHHETAVVAHVARKLGHAVVVTTDGDVLRFFALPIDRAARPLE